MLAQILDQVLNTQAVKDKLGIAATHALIGDEVLFTNPFGGSAVRIPVGDDCAAIPDGDNGYLLFSAEGIISPFLESAPWFAGYSAVMVNISDICAMGGLPLALTDVVWLKDAADGSEIWAGMKAAAEAYGVPIVGGHTCYRSEKKHLAVAILGRANHLLSSYDAKKGDALLMAADLDGSYFEQYPFWNASTNASPAHLRNCMRLMNKIADLKLCCAAKDISMGGIIGTLAMLLNTSAAGANIFLEKLPIPSAVALEKWLVSFPSFGYLLTASPDKVELIRSVFNDAGISCEMIGEITAPGHLQINYNEESITIHLK